MDYYKIYPILKSGPFWIENLKVRNIKDFDDFYVDVFFNREIKPDSDFIFKYKMHDLDNDKIFRQLDILNINDDQVVTNKFFDAIYDDIKDNITSYKAVVIYKDQTYDNYTTFMVNNIIDIFFDNPDNPYDRSMKSTLKKQFINAEFDIAMDSETHITIFSERLVEKLKAADAHFDLRKIPYEA